MVFEKMRGGPLLNHIQRKVCFTEQEASLVTRDIAQALKYLHQRGVAHRDVKPENILCTDLDRVSPVKLCDLDLASKPSLHLRKHSRTLHNVASEPDLASPVGSAEFMAPEVVDTFVGDALRYDKRCDMWSLGVIIYIMLCGYTPFYGECERDNCGWDQGKPCNDCQDSLFHRIQTGEFDFPEEEWANISADAKNLIKHLLVKNVRERYTAQDVLNHRWVCGAAPETPLQTANNLFRNDSARDVHQMNEHFNVMNRLTAVRLSANLEEQSGSLSSSPDTENDLIKENFGMEKVEKSMEKPIIPVEEPQKVPDVSDVVTEKAEPQVNGPEVPDSEATDSEIHNEPSGNLKNMVNHHVEASQAVKLEPSHVNNPQFQQYNQPVMFQQPPPVYNQQIPMINMNGILLYAPPQDYYYNQVYQQQQQRFFNGRHSQLPQQAMFQQQPPPQYQYYSNQPQNIDAKVFRGRQNRPERLRTQRSLTPGYQQHQQRNMAQTKKTNLLRNQSGLETCQNAMVRQVSCFKFCCLFRTVIWS